MAAKGKFLVGLGALSAVFAACAAWVPSPQEVRSGPGDGAAREDLERRLRNLADRPGARAEAMALRGMLEGLQSRDAASSGKRVAHLRRCLALLAEGVREDPTSAIVRGHRASLELHLPRFFRDRGLIADDLEVIRAALAHGGASQEHPRELTREERTWLSQVLQQWEASTPQERPHAH